MTRSLRLEYAGAVYHVTSRGDRREAIYRDHTDRIAWLDTLELVCRRFNLVIYAFCQMTNHYHLMVETVEGNLSAATRQLNGIYSQHFNRRHRLVGHVFQGRYKAILVQKECYLLELTRYVVLNPIRAGMVSTLNDWPWSSHHFMLRSMDAPRWLDTDWLLSQFCGERESAVLAYCRFVQDGTGAESPLKNTSHQLILGDDTFVGGHQQGLPPEPLRAVSKAHRRAVARTLDHYQQHFPDREEAMARAYYSTAFTMDQIAAHFGVSQTTVSRAIKLKEVNSGQ